MKKKTIKMSKPEDINFLVLLTTQVEGDVVIHRGRHSVDAKSYLGIAALDMSDGVIIEYPDNAIALDAFLSYFSL